MARNDDGNRIRSVGQAHGSRGVWISEPARQLAIGSGLAVRNCLKHLPDAKLKIGADQRQWQVEISQLAGKISAQLADGFVEGRRIFAPIRFWALGTLACGETD